MYATLHTYLAAEHLYSIDALISHVDLWSVYHSYTQSKCERTQRQARKQHVSEMIMF